MWKTCARDVEGLFTVCRPKYFFCAPPCKLTRSPGSGAGSSRVSLAVRQRINRITSEPFAPHAAPVNIIRFHETINGRPYVIETLSVGDRWRAQLARIPGGTTALMPFYGSTPDEAAHHLTEWLTRAAARVVQSRKT